MDSLLLCDEDWLKSSPTNYYDDSKSTSCMRSFYTTKEDYENAHMVHLQKETEYMPKSGYIERLSHSSDLMFARIKAVRFFIKSQGRLNLDVETVFHATNYFDRFISMKECNIGAVGLVELLSVACLSIAAKFVEVTIPQLHEIQMEDLDHSFQPSTIQQTELMVLKALEWRLFCVTSYSYLELLMSLLESLQPAHDYTITSRVTELLLGALSDPRFIQFRPCTVVVSALRCSLEELVPSKSNACLSNLLTLIPQDQKEDMSVCYKIMEEQVADPINSFTTCGHSHFPSSPVTVMPMQRTDAVHYVDPSLFVAATSNMNLSANSKKRKREEVLFKHCHQCK